MFKFFRKNIQTIGWVIVITFGLTMFGGSLFINSGGQRQTEQNTTAQNSFASVGKYPLSYERYVQLISNIAQMSNPDQKQFSPNDIEYLQSQALLSTMTETIFYQSALNLNVTLSKDEFKKGFQQFLLENDLKDKAAVKKLLKERDFDYSKFEESLKRQLLVEKFQKNLTADINVTEAIVPLAFSKLKIQMISINNESSSLSENENLSAENKTEETPKTALEKANEVYNEILAGLDFNDAFKLYSATKFDKNQGIYTDVTFTTLPENIEKVIFELDKGEVSEPIILNEEALLVKVLDITKIEYPENFNQDQFLLSLKNSFKQRRLSEFRENFLKENPLTVEERRLKPIVLKQQQDYFGAIGAYQYLSSTSIDDPTPHFFMADIYVKLNQIDNALEELAKADLKASLSAQTDFPELHFFYGDLLLDQGNKDLAVEQYNKLFSLIENNITALNQLKQRYLNLNLTEKSQEIDEHITQLEELNQENLNLESTEESSLEELN